MTSEQAENDQALEVCLEEIDKCRPFFLGLLGERYGWVSDQIPDRVANKRAGIRDHPGKSITELEILYAVLNNPTMHDYACFFQARLSLPLVKHSAHDSRTVDPLSDEYADQERFIESRTRVYVGCQHTALKLMRYADGSPTVPCLVTGVAGSGKSAALAKFALDYATRYPNAVVIPHFVGASAESTSLRGTLRRLCTELTERAGLGGRGIPDDFDRQVAAFADILNQVSVDLKVLVIINGLDQFGSLDGVRDLYWLPQHEKFSECEWKLGWST